MKYKHYFAFFDTEEQAAAFCNRENATGSHYKRTNKKAHFTPWVSNNVLRFVAWYYA